MRNPLDDIQTIAPKNELLPLKIILERLETSCKEAQLLGYAHQPIVVCIMDLFEGGHIAAFHLEYIVEAANKAKKR